MCSCLAILQEDYPQVQAEKCQLLALLPSTKCTHTNDMSPGRQCLPCAASVGLLHVNSVVVLIIFPASPWMPLDSPCIHTALNKYGSITDILGPKPPWSMLPPSPLTSLAYRGALTPLRHTSSLYYHLCHLVIGVWLTFAGN